MITEIYPSFRKDRDPVLTSRLWHELFKNVPYASVRLALMDFFATDTKGFAPTPGALFSLIRSRIETEEELSEMDGIAKSIAVKLLKTLSVSVSSGMELPRKIGEQKDRVVAKARILEEKLAEKKKKETVN